MAQKVEFLQGKGLTDTEIQQALSEAANGTSNPSAAYARPQPSYQQQPHYGFQAAVVAPEPPKRDWRDIFVSLREGCVSGPQRERAVDPPTQSSGGEQLPN